MSSITTFFRHCPSCGRRFEIRLVGRNLVGTAKNTYPKARTAHFVYPVQRGGYGGPIGMSTELDENVQVTVERKEFQYAYKCKHCGHQWAEERFEETQPSYLASNQR
ncbi:MAG: hypothetical protein ACLQEQ_01955 [Nitrososphaerales archaeon]